MHVLQLGPIPPPNGGVQTNLMAIRDLLRSRGHRATMIGVPRYLRSPHEDAFYPESAPALIGKVRELAPDIVHLHLGGFPGPPVWAMALALTQLAPRSVMTFHSGGYANSPQGRSAGRWTARGFVLRRFSRIVVVNPQMEALFSRFGVASDRIRLIYPQILRTPPRDLVLRADLAEFFAAHDPVLVSVGLLEPEYDLPRQIDLLGEILGQHPRAGLLMIGSGSLEADLRRQIAAKSYASRILLTGDVPHAMTLAAIQRAAALLRLTLYDGDAVSVREALYLNTPVVATDTGMRPAGPHLVPVGDTPSAVAAILRVCAQPSPPRRMEGEDQSNIEKVLALYQELCGA